jgi:hypothetical protein
MLRLLEVFFMLLAMNSYDTSVEMFNDNLDVHGA